MGQLATPDWVFYRGVILSTAAVAPHDIVIVICLFLKPLSQELLRTG